jgi:uncharacterized cupin superfamily protein
VSEETPLPVPPLQAVDVPVSTRKTIYPSPFAEQVQGRIKRRIGDHFGLQNFGVNLTRLEPGAVSALMHHHSKQDEFVYVLEGHPVAFLGSRSHALQPGDCFGFPAGTGLAHRLANPGPDVVTYLEIGDRSPADVVDYPDDDLAFGVDANGATIMTHKDGRPY